MAQPWAAVAEAGSVCCILAWLASNAYDLLHPKLGHSPYGWRHPCAYPLPWPAHSALRAYQGQTARPSPYTPATGRSAANMA